MDRSILQLLKETGARVGEAFNLKWTDIDFKNRTLSITPEKRGNPRLLRISPRLSAMLQERLVKSSSEKLFHQKISSLRRTFERQRKRTAQKIKNPRINKITFHSLRHFKATMEYQRTKDILDRSKQHVDLHPPGQLRSGGIRVEGSLKRGGGR